MTQTKGYKYRIYPSALQREQIERTLGCCRFVYNHFLAARKEAWKEDKVSLSYTQTASMLTVLKRDCDHLWLACADSMALQESLRNLDRAYTNFFAKRAGYPKFHKKHASVHSYRTRNQSNGIRIDGNTIVLPRIGKVRAKISRLPKGRILNATVSRTATGKYFVSLCCEEELVPKPNAGGVVGIDLGIKALYTDSNGYTEPNPKYIHRYEKKLHREQKKLSRMLEANIKGYDKTRKPIWKRPLSECKNIQKQRRKVALVHEKVYNSRTDALHKMTTKLVSENQVIAIEALNIKGMVRNHKLAKAISDAAWGRAITMLEYKVFEYGTDIIKVPTFFPSSQKCFDCGYKNPLVKDLLVRDWVCPECGSTHDRDFNAAKNILKVALATP